MKTVQRHPAITTDEYQKLCDSYGGVCLACGELAWSDTEPDAEGYKCGSCDAMQVMGIELALLGGHVDLVETA